MNLTIQSAADLWLHTLETRKRKPAKPATLATFSSYIRGHIAPDIGSLVLASFENGLMREFVARLSEKELAPKTINEISNVVRQIVASVVDKNGNELFPRKWNSDFIDAPVVECQHQPTVTVAQIEQAIATAPESDAVLYLLLASSGLRVGEAIALKVGESFADGAVIVRSSVWRRREQAPKTAAALREVELAKPAAERILQFAEGRSGYLFGNGLPPAVSTLRERLAERGIPGFHSFRRFRATTLRAARCPEELIRYFLGHADQSITDRYSSLASDAKVRREWADRVGTGFEVPKCRP
jgi:integrase